MLSGPKKNREPAAKVRHVQRSALPARVASTPLPWRGAEGSRRRWGVGETGHQPLPQETCLCSRDRSFLGGAVLHHIHIITQHRAADAARSFCIPLSSQGGVALFLRVSSLQPSDSHGLWPARHAKHISVVIPSLRAV